MNIEINSEKINSCRVIASEKKLKIIEGEIIVPDIKPDILSLSTIDAEVYLTKKNINEGSVDVEGVLDVCAIYVSDDETGSLKSLNNVFNFQDTLMIADVNLDSNVKVKLSKSAIEYKIINGRKIGIKVPITIDVVVSNNTETLVAKDVVDDRNIQTLKERHTINMMSCCKEQEVELNENVTLDDNKSPIGEILKATMKIEKPEYKISYNKILVKADAVIKIIYTADNDAMNVEIFEKTLPIMGFIESEGMNTDNDIKLEFDIKSFVIRPIYQDLKSMSFGVESEIIARICSYQKEEIELLVDVYNPETCLKCNFEKIELNQNIINKIECLELKQDLPVQDLENVRVLTISARPTVINKNVLDEKIVLDGSIELETLFFNRTTNTIESKKIDLPIVQTLRVEELKANMKPEIDVEIGNITYLKTGANSIEVRIPVCVRVEVSKSEYINGITSIESVEEELPNLPSLAIYYVKEGDSLWKIAKKYRTTVEDIMRYNELNDDKIYPGDQLLIPKRTKCKSIELL